VFDLKTALNRTKYCYQTFSWETGAMTFSRTTHRKNASHKMTLNKVALGKMTLSKVALSKMTPKSPRQNDIQQNAVLPIVANFKLLCWVTLPSVMTFRWTTLRKNGTQLYDTQQSYTRLNDTQDNDTQQNDCNRNDVQKVALSKMALSRMILSKMLFCQ
jgi:hypothetical protein